MNFINSRLPVLYVMDIVTIVCLLIGLFFHLDVIPLLVLCLSSAVAISAFSLSFFPSITITLLLHDHNASDNEEQKGGDSSHGCNLVTLWIDGRKFEYDKSYASQGKIIIQEKIILWCKGVFEIVVSCGSTVKTERIEVWSRRCQSVRIEI